MLFSNIKRNCYFICSFFISSQVMAIDPTPPQQVFNEEMAMPTTGPRSEIGDLHVGLYAAEGRLDDLEDQIKTLKDSQAKELADMLAVVDASDKNINNLYGKTDSLEITSNQIIAAIQQLILRINKAGIR